MEAPPPAPGSRKPRVGEVRGRAWKPRPAAARGTPGGALPWRRNGRPAPPSPCRGLGPSGAHPLGRAEAPARPRWGRRRERREARKRGRLPSRGQGGEDMAPEAIMQLPACLACPLLPSPPRGGAARSWTGGPAPLGSRVWPRDGPSTTVQTFRARAGGPRCWPLPTHTPGICCWTVQTPLLGCRPGPRSALPGDPAKLAARQADPDPFLACIPIGWGLTRQARPVGPDDLSPQSCVSGSARVGGQTSPDLL